MSGSRTKIESRILTRGSKFRDLQIEGLELRFVSTQLGAADTLRPTIENVHIKKLRMRRSNIGYSVLRDVTVEGIDTDAVSSFLFGNEYYGVKFRGKTKLGLIFAALPTADELREGYRMALRSSEADPNWRIDISEIQGRVSVRGYAADGFVINPEFQCVVRNNPATVERWEHALPAESPFRIGIEQMFRNGWSDTILAADGNAADYEDQVALLQHLREEGIAQ